MIRFTVTQALVVSVMLLGGCGKATDVDACGPERCAGCCDAEGFCQLGQAEAACGAGGAVCTTCGTGQSCEAGVCTGGPANGCEPSSTTPSGRSDFAAGFDAESGRIVVFGGDPGVAVNCESKPQFDGQTWLFDTTCGTWIQLEGNGPSPRARHVGVFDTQRRRFVVFGGRYREGTSGSYTTYNDAYALQFVGEAAVWDQLLPTGTPPPPLSSSAAVYDPQGDRMLVFGGNTSNSGATFAPVDRLWSLSFANNAWTELTPTTSTRPPARLFHAAALDAKRNRLVVYGGGDENAFLGPFLDGVWAFDLETRAWSQLALSGASPQPRIRPMLVEDPERDRVLVFGGHDDGEMGERNDLWAIDFANMAWVELRPGDVFKTPGAGFCDFPSDFTEPDLSVPERREGGFLGAVPGYGHVMFGGRSDCGVVNDVWRLDPTQHVWEELRPAFAGLSCQRSGKTDCSKLCF